MIDAILGIATSLPALVLSGGLSGIGLVGPALGLFKNFAWLARLVGVGALMLCAFIGGYRTADERAELDKVRAANAHLQRDLNAQKTVADAASAARATLQSDRAELQSKVTAYELMLNNPVTVEAPPAKPGAKPKPPAPVSCGINDADVRFYRSLFDNRRRK